MNNKTNSNHHRYASNPLLIIKNKPKNRCVSTLKNNFLDQNKTMCHYKSIRGARKDVSSHNTHRKTLTEAEQRRQSNHNPDHKIAGQDLIDVAKMKLHNLSPNKSRVKTQMTINREEFHQFLKKKKPTQFSTSRSLEEIRMLFPKKIDVILNHIRAKTTQRQNSIKEQSEIYRPITAAKNKRYIMRGVKRYQTKNVILIEKTIKTQPKEDNLLTSCEITDVSGWQVQPPNSQFIRNMDKKEKKQLLINISSQTKR